MHYGVGPGSGAEERKWWDYAGARTRRAQGYFLPLCVVNCSDLQGLQGYGCPILVPSKPRQLPDLKIILNQRMTVVSRA